MTRLGKGPSLAFNLAAAGDRLFWFTASPSATATTFYVNGMRVGQGVPWTLQAKLSVFSLSSAGDNLFFSGFDATQTDASKQGVVVQVSANGSGAPRILHTHGGRPFGTTADNEYLYWTLGGAGSVVRCPLAGCNGEPEVIVSSEADPIHVAVDETAVYYTRPSGVYKVAKPTPRTQR
jgi:hypothetical protein